MTSKAVWTILLLFVSNSFMTLAWYGHLKFKQYKALAEIGLPLVILISWGIALLEYAFQVPANRIGSDEYGGPFSLMQLKVIQEAITLLVFSLFYVFFFNQGSLKWNHLAGFAFLIVAVYLIFKK